MPDAQSDPVPTETPAPPPAVAPVDAASPAGEHGPAHAGKARLPHSVQTVKHGAVVAEPLTREGANVRTLRSSSEPSRSFTESQARRLANVDKHGRYDDTPGEPAADPAKPTGPVPASPAPTGAQPEKPAPTTEPDLAARAARLAEHNKRLVLENEQLRARGGADPDERLQSLDAIERDLSTDFLGALRKLVALHVGAKEAADPSVDRFMRGGYAQWTSKEIGADLDAGQLALIESDRNRLLIDRHKRDTAAAAKAAEERAAAERESQHAAAVGRQLNTHLTDTKHAERFPLLMKHSKTFDGLSPGELLFSAVRAGIKAGEFPPDADNKILIDHYSEEIENHYKGIRDSLAEPATSTAAPAPAPVPPTDKKADATESGVRTITNASASVAPPAPPAKPTTPAPTDQNTASKRRPGERESAFRERVAKLYFDQD